MLKLYYLGYDLLFAHIIGYSRYDLTVKKLVQACLMQCKQPNYGSNLARFAIFTIFIVFTALKKPLLSTEYSSNETLFVEKYPQGIYLNT